MRSNLPATLSLALRQDTVPKHPTGNVTKRGNHTMPASTPAPPRMTVEELETFLATAFPQMNHGGRSYVVEAVRPDGASMRLIAGERHARPGGTLSGPSMMALADYAMYAAVLGAIGPVPLAVTTNLSMNFLRRPPLGDLLADCTLMKLGRRLAVGDVALRPEGGTEMVAHAVVTYSIPDAMVL